MINSLIVATSNSLLVTTLALARHLRACRATSWSARRTSSSGRSPTAWRRRRCSCCRSSCCSRRPSRSATGSSTTPASGSIFLYCVFNLPFAIWTLRGIVDGIPQGARRGGLCRRRQHLAGADPGHPAAGPAGAGGDGDPDLGVRLERVPVRRHPDQRACPHASPPGLAEFVTVTGTNWGQMAATATLTLLPALLFLGLRSATSSPAYLRRGDRSSQLDLVGRRARRIEPRVPADITNAFDRVFIGVVLFVAIHLLWMRFLERRGSRSTSPPRSRWRSPPSSSPGIGAMAEEPSATTTWSAAAAPAASSPAASWPGAAGSRRRRSEPHPLACPRAT